MSDLYISQNSLGYVVVTNNPKPCNNQGLLGNATHPSWVSRALRPLFWDPGWGSKATAVSNIASFHGRRTERDHGEDRVSCPAIKYLVKLKNKKWHILLLLRIHWLKPVKWSHSNTMGSIKWPCHVSRRQRTKNIWWVALMTTTFSVFYWFLIWMRLCSWEGHFCESEEWSELIQKMMSSKSKCQPHVITIVTHSRPGSCWAFLCKESPRAW